MNVTFDAVHTQRTGVIERGNRILGPQRGASTMRDGDDAIGGKEIFHEPCG